MPTSPPRPTPKSARKTAWQVLQTLHRDAYTPLPEIINALSHKEGLDQRDTRLLTMLVYGVLRTQVRLDFALNQYLHKAPSQELYDLLRLGAYELLWTNIAAHASVDQYVRLCRGKYAELAGLVNAVLRGLDRDRQSILERDAAILAEAKLYPTAENLIFLGSLPTWLAVMWLEQYGPDFAYRLAESVQHQPVPTYRVNAARLPEYQNFFCEDGNLSIILTGNDPRFVQAEARGLLSRQGTASIQAISKLAEYLESDPRFKNAEIWDSCCGRGNKTCAMLEANLEVSLASDPSPARLTGLKKNLSRLGLATPQIQCSTLQDLADSLNRQFPVIVLDVPCSGSGTLARNPELRWRLNPEQLGQHALLQAELLDKAWFRLSPGGLLAYITCALHKTENEEQIRSFCARHVDACSVLEEYIFPDYRTSGDSIFLSFLRKE